MSCIWEPGILSGAKREGSRSPRWASTPFGRCDAASKRVDLVDGYGALYRFSWRSGLLGPRRFVGKYLKQSQIFAFIAILAMSVRAVVAPGYMLAVAQTPNGPQLSVTICPSGLPEGGPRLNWTVASSHAQHAEHDRGHATAQSGHDHSAHGHGAPMSPEGLSGQHHPGHDHSGHHPSGHAHGDSATSKASPASASETEDHTDHQGHGADHPCVFAVASHVSPPTQPPAPIAYVIAPSVRVELARDLRPGLGLPAPPPPSTGPPSL
jgi:hypothetical protein